MVLPPITYHPRRHVGRVAERRRSTGAAIGAPATASRTIACKVIWTCTWMSGGVIGRAAVLDDLLAHLVIGQRHLGNCWKTDQQKACKGPPSPSRAYEQCGRARRQSLPGRQLAYAPAGRTTSSTNSRVCRFAMTISPATRSWCAVSASIGAPSTGIHAKGTELGASRGRKAIGVHAPSGRCGDSTLSLIVGRFFIPGDRVLRKQ